MGIHDSLLVELFDVDDTESLILKSGLEVTQGHTNWCHSKAWVQFPIVTMAVTITICDIFSVKKWRDLENQVMGRLRSLKMAPFDRPYATFYWSAIVTVALSCTIFELFVVK